MQPSTRIDIAPHCSLTQRGAWLFFASVSLGTLAVAAMAATQGFWPVLPFAGLELALLGWALHQSMQRRYYRHSISVDEQTIAIERHDQRRVDRHEFPRYWARVRIHAPRSPLHPSRLFIESHGRGCEVGDFLTEPERQSLARRLRGLVGAT